MRINPTLTTSLKDTLVKALVERDTESLLRDPAVQHAATQYCFFCTDAAQTTDLRAHLRHAHNLDHRSCAPLVHTLIDCLQPSCHNFCPLCDLQETAQSHLVQCLVLHQIVFILHTIQNGHSRFLGGCESGGGESRWKKRSGTCPVSWANQPRRPWRPTKTTPNQPARGPATGMATNTTARARARANRTNRPRSLWLRATTTTP